MKHERISELRTLANKHEGHQSAEIIHELLDEIERLQAIRAQRKSAAIAPWINDVKAYAHDIGLTNNDANEFYNYFAARGWAYKSGAAMKDWRAALRTWKTNKERYRTFIDVDKTNDREVMSPAEQQRLRLQRKAKNSDELL